MPTAVKIKPVRRVRGNHELHPRALKAPEPRTAVKGDSRTVRSALMIICLGALMSSIDATVTNVALNTLERDLHTSVASVQWVMTAYLLTVAGVIPVSGWASRRFGARRVYVTSLALFGLSSGLCAMAGSLEMLVASRLLQGLAGGMLVPLGQLIAAEVAGSDQMGKMMSRIWTFSSLGSMLGPTIGGAILETMGWRWIFMINLPVSAIATIAAVYLLPRTPSRPAGKLDVGGLLRLSLGVPATVFALAQAEQTGNLFALSAVIPMVVGVVLILDFIRHALRSSRPLLDIRLCSRPTFRTGMTTIFLVDVAWFGVLVLLPLAFQQLLHLSPMATGMLMAPQGVGTATGMWLSGRMGDTRLARNLGAIGTFVIVGTTLMIASFDASVSLTLICPTLFIAGLGAGFSWIPSTAAGYTGLRPDEISHGSPLVSVTMRLGASFGTAIAAILLQAHLDSGSSAHAAYRAAFHWEAAVAFIAALAYIWLCRVATRSTKAAPKRTAVETSVGESDPTGNAPAKQGSSVVVCRDHNRRLHGARARTKLGASTARRNAKIARDRLGGLLQRAE